MVRSIVLIEAASLYARMSAKIYEACTEFRLMDDFENAYDWCIIEAVARIMVSKTNQHFKIQNHIRMDFYRCVFDLVKFDLIPAVSATLENGGVILKGNSQLKILVTSSELIIVHRPF